MSKKDENEKKKGKGKGKGKDKEDDKKKNKKDTKDNKNNNQASSEEEDLDDMHLSRHASKKGKPEKGQGLTLILETKIHNFDVKDVFHKLIFLHDTYRSTNKSLESEYKLEYFNHTWQEFLPENFDKLQDRTRMRVTNRTYNVPIQLPVIPRPKQQYLGINLKQLLELPTGITGGKLSPYVTLWVSSQHKYRTLIKQHVNDYTFHENFVIPVAYSHIQKGRIACFLELAVFNFNSHGTDARIGKAKLPLAVLERGHAKPRGVVIKLDKGGSVDMEIRWFENDQLIIAPEDTKGFRRSIGIGGVFFTPPSIIKEKKNMKKPRADELEWFLNLPQFPLKDLIPGDIVIIKFYDILYEEDKPINEIFYQIVDTQKDIIATKATCFSVGSFIVTKEGGENISIQGTGGIVLDSKFPNYNCLVYRCKNTDYAKEAAAWAQDVLAKYPSIKFAPRYEEGFTTEITPNVDNQNLLASKEFPESMTMTDTELVVGAYQCRKGNPMIDINAKNVSPILLENHLNTHLENHFSFLGIVVQNIDEQEIAKRGPPRSEKSKKKQTKPSAVTDSPKKEKPPKEKKTKGAKGKKDDKDGDPEPAAIPLALQGPTGVHKSPIFGLSLVDAYGDGTEVPYFWESVFGFLNQPEFCSTVGIFRVPGSADEANWYKRLFDEGRDVVFDCSCHDAVGLIKMYIRELPENVIPSTYDQQIPMIMSQYKDGSPELLKEIKFIIDQMPKAHYIFFKLLMYLLYNILLQAEINKMHSDNLIRCIVPTMKCGPQIVAIAFNNYPYIFGETELPGENENSSIPEKNDHPHTNNNTENLASSSEVQATLMPRGPANRSVVSNRGVVGRTGQTPKEPAVRAKPAWMSQANAKPEATPEIKTITINVGEGTDINDSEKDQVSPRGQRRDIALDEKQKRKKNRRSEVFFYNPIITQKESPTQDNDSQLETAFQLAEANESETSEDIEYSEDNLSSSSSSEIIIK